MTQRTTAECECGKSLHSIKLPKTFGRSRIVWIHDETGKSFCSPGRIATPLPFKSLGRKKGTKNKSRGGW